MIHYMDGGPFETKAVWEGTCFVLAYDDEAERFIYAYSGREPPLGFVTGKREARDFDPPPPIPAAARKPKVGEVWSCQTGSLKFFVVVAEGGGDHVLIVAADGEVYWRSRCNLSRPATPEEAEPFRELLEGLKRSLGEE